MSETGEIHYVEGSIVDCLCPKCQVQTEHTILSVTKRSIRDVRCEMCQFPHRYSTTKKPAAEPAGPLAARGRKRKTREDEDLVTGTEWEAQLGERGPVEPVAYRLGGSYAEGNVIRHQLFGVGIVRKVLYETKIEVLFQGGLKYLIQNIRK